MWKKRIISGLLAVVMLAGATVSMTGCQKEKENNVPESELVQNLKEKWYVGDNIKLDWYVNLSWWQYNNDWMDYPVLKEITQITGVEPSITIPTGTGSDKLALMMASNTLPDLITVGTDDAMLDKLISQGYVYSYDELIEKYAPEFKDEIDPVVWSYHTYEDGKLYQLPCYFVKEANQVGSSTYNVRRDIYEELGEPDMSTPEGFYNALKAFKEKYPTIEGKSSIPLTFGTGYYRYMFEESFGINTYYVTSEGDVQIRFKNPNYVELAKYLNKLYREGLLDPEVFVKQDSGLNEDLAAGRVFCYPCNYWDLNSVNASLNKQKEGSGFGAIEPMQAVEDVSYPGTNRRGWMVTLVSKDTKNPEEVIKFIRFMWSEEGNLLANYGHEGEHYTIEGNVITRTEEVVDAMANDPDNFANSTGIRACALFSYPYYLDSASDDPVTINNDALAQKYGKDNTVFSYKMTPDSSTREGEISTRVWDIYEREWPKMVMAESEDKAVEILNNMISSMEAQGLELLEDYWTERYKLNVEKFE